MKTGYELLLPQGILNTFEVSDVQESDEKLILHLDEKNVPPERSLHFIGFYPPTDITDFPVRGKKLTLRIRRRRWRNQRTGAHVMREWNLVVEGTHMTKEFAFYLKVLP